MAEKTRQDCGSMSPIEKATKTDAIRQEYKRYKRKKPLPDFSEVIDFRDPQTFRGRVSEFRLKNLPHSRFGLSCAKNWKVYSLDNHPGFLFIVNPFLDGAQEHWTRRCLADFPRKPNMSNLDAHMTIGKEQSIWQISHSEEEHQHLIDRLRWVHLGYQFDYNVVDYIPEKYYGFPEDLGGLMQHIAEAIGYPGYTPEAGIVNYYPLGSSMGGHTDHYELDLHWPLISLSFGQSAIFLIGGKTRDIMPSALYIHSGDILIMSEEARIAFHAIPRIVEVPTKDHLPPGLQRASTMDEIDNRQACSCTGNENGVEISRQRLENTEIKDKEAGSMRRKGNDTNERDEICSESTNNSCCIPDAFLSGVTPSQEQWQPFADYLAKNRININVRQVHCPGNTVSVPII